MYTLGIETSGRAGSVAILRDDAVLAERFLSPTGRRHACTLVPEIGDLLSEQGISLQELGLIAVSIGPGSFTGLRVGVTCAKTLSYALTCPVMGVDTFLAVAASSPSDVQHVWVIDNALRGDVFAGEYQYTQSRWEVITAPQLVAFEAWRDSAGDSFVSGPATTLFEQDLESLQPLPAACRTPVAAAIAQQGRLLFSDGRRDSAWDLTPHYIRRSAAEEKADAQSS